MEEAEAAWEHTAPEVVPVRAQGGCWRSLQSETARFKRLEGPQRGGKNQVRIENWPWENLKQPILYTSGFLPCLFLGSSAGTGFLRLDGFVASSSWLARLQTPGPPTGTVWPFFSAGGFSFSGSSPSARGQEGRETNRKHSESRRRRRQG